MAELNQMKHISVYKNIYIDLDAYLDTRLGMLYHIDKKLFDYYTKDEEGIDKYFNRLIDEFEYIDSKTFNKIYKKRDKSVLKFSRITYAHANLALTIGDVLYKRSAGDKYMKPLEIDVNIYPYNLTDDEKDLIKAGILSKIGNRSSVIVNIINVKNEYLDTETVSNRYGVVVKYDFWEWLKLRGLLGDMRSNAPSTLLVAPALLDRPLIMKEPNDYIRYFDDIKKTLQYYINLDFNGISLFNYVRTEKEKD